MVRRKDYRSLPDKRLDSLKADAVKLLGTIGSMTLPGETICWLVMEVIDSREEIFRLQLCETVDRIVADELNELDDEEDLLAFRWPDDYCIDDDVGDSFKPAFPCKETGRLPTTVVREGRPSDHEGRRIPRVE